jgi:hypothetical protein
MLTSTAGVLFSVSLDIAYLKIPPIRGSSVPSQFVSAISSIRRASHHDEAGMTLAALCER